ncbi:MAG: hypothetical protein Q9211_003472, partial [Gyalolechia sp. 1 TL-2023]
MSQTTQTTPPIPDHRNADGGPVVKLPPNDGNQANPPNNPQNAGNDARPNPAGQHIPRWQLPRCQRCNGLQHDGDCWE